MKPAPPVTSTRGIRSVTRSFENCQRRTDQELEVVPQGPIVDVLQVETRPIREICDALPTVDLPDARKTWLHAQLPHLPELEVSVLGRKNRSRANQAHVSNQNAPELRELVEAMFPQPTSERCDARILRHLEYRPAPLVEVEKPGLQCACVANHLAE